MYTVHCNVVIPAKCDS